MGMNGILSQTMGLALNKSEQLMKTRRKIYEYTFRSVGRRSSGNLDIF